MNGPISSRANSPSGESIPAPVDQLLEVDQKRRKLQGELDQIRADRKRRAKEVGKLPPDERAAEIAKIRAEEAAEEKLAKLSTGVGSWRVKVARCEQPFAGIGLCNSALAERNVDELALTLPNIPRPYVVVGASEADNRVIKTEGTPI